MSLLTPSNSGGRVGRAWRFQVMKNGLLAVGVLLGGACVVAHAEYVRFIYTPGVVKKEAPDPQNANAGQFPGQAGFGAGGPMGGRFGQAGMRGMAGMPGGAGAEGGAGMPPN